MQVQDVMTHNARYMAPDATLQEVARRMRELDCGFLPVSNPAGEKLAGAVTDRDITVRAVAEGLDPATTTASDIMSSRIAYCFAGDDLAEASRKMSEQGIYRLVVLDDRDSKQLCGIISVGDILRHDQESLAAATAREISRKAA